MTRRQENPSRHYVEHGTLSKAAYERYEKLKKAERELRLADRDAEYRRMLGIASDQPMPKQIGSAGGTRSASYNGVRGTKRLA